MGCAVPRGANLTRDSEVAVAEFSTAPFSFTFLVVLRVGRPQRPCFPGISSVRASRVATATLGSLG